MPNPALAAAMAGAKFEAAASDQILVFADEEVQRRDDQEVQRSALR